ncbi:hypothetical protein CDD80_764 [Ophiocordyceps camponoti-rufipedis]|uniref:Uncharacterized protein n=1 Tax=Ophiocordyceps camponoti-rufipedis TaxID=2004952 RepID=A0A2C5YDE9_9HYPO|nr:hypothetical protein CDD80_764 [Ophiocordyceps camponoti-rufipedis]
MASSLATDLWDAIFTPGTTPALLRATNISFACLQLVLGALLAATASLHFVMLSGLCAVLWWSVNWFVAEMEAEKRKLSSRGDESSDTEVEESVGGARSGKSTGELRLRTGGGPPSLDGALSSNGEDDGGDEGADELRERGVDVEDAEVDAR